MGGSSEPDGDRGFGRVYLEEGLPLNGAGHRGLLVVDSSTASVAEGTKVDYPFDTDGSDDDAGEIRATLAWIDPEASAVSTKQLVNDLDLEVIAPSGTSYTMWLDGRSDSDNVIERVIISADDFAAEESGTWTVSVSANELSTESQSYSLVVWGPFGDGEDVVFDEDDIAVDGDDIVVDEDDTAVDGDDVFIGDDDAVAASGSQGGFRGTFAGLSLVLVLPFLARMGAALVAGDFALV